MVETCGVEKLEEARGGGCDLFWAGAGLIGWGGVDFDLVGWDGGGEAVGWLVGVG